MSHNAQSSPESSLNPVALSSYAVAICSLAIAPLALVFHDFPGAGLAAVGGFYLVVGVSSHVMANLKAQSQTSHGIGGHTSGAENLVAEAIANTREVVSSSTGSLVGSAR